MPAFSKASAFTADYSLSSLVRVWRSKYDWSFYLSLSRSFLSWASRRLIILA